ncbi:MAG: copper amine oxidase N-terminal domain-containing protein [Clostridia bacterium]|jgi:PKD repeat protein|nr:copper amine oxidase N-terminal domain-containing protein [Clostridia bacterium]MDH7572407.1 copper amine oxidase N-terminal domain-containing protein [Clostridia bacterium]
MYGRRVAFSWFGGAVLFFAVLAFLSASAWAAAPGEVLAVLKLDSRRAEIQGRQVELAAAPRMVNGTTLVPLRFFAQSLGLAVAWDQESRTATVEGTPRLVLQVGSTRAKVDEREEVLPVAPVLDRGVVLIPLRFAVQNLACRVDYRAETREILVYPPEKLPVAVIAVNKQQVYLGEKLEYRSESYSPEGLALVEERWTNRPPWSAPGEYTLTLQVRDEQGRWSLPAQVTIEVLPPPNRAPVARFQVSKTVVAQGERVEYVDDSYDPDGDDLVQKEWQGRREVFFAPGTYPVSLRVKDEHGLWSEPYRVTITVTQERLMDEIAYYLLHTLPGDSFTLPGNRYPELVSVITQEAAGGPRLLLSNSPEAVPGPGILYRDTAEGPTRVFFWHANGTGGPLRILLLAENPAETPARLTVEREGIAGPERDPLGVGRKGMLRYWGSAPRSEVVLSPGELYIVNYSQYRPIKPGEVLYGIYDLRVEGRITLTVAALPAEGEIGPIYPQLSVLPPDNVHTRGTFAAGNWEIKASLPEGRVAGWTVPGDWLPRGTDVLTGREVENRGGYGVVYSFTLDTPEERVVLLNPRGGAMAGAVWANGFLVPLPRTGVRSAAADMIKAAVLPAGRAEIMFMPPGGTNLPLRFLFWPLP